MSKIAKLKVGRSAFGIVNIGNQIYVLGGYKDIDGCERYNIKYDLWKDYIPLPYFRVGP